MPHISHISSYSHQIPSLGYPAVRKYQAIHNSGKLLWSHQERKRSKLVSLSCNIVQLKIVHSQNSSLQKSLSGDHFKKILRGEDRRRWRRHLPERQFDEWWGSVRDSPVAGPARVIWACCGLRGSGLVSPRLGTNSPDLTNLSQPIIWTLAQACHTPLQTDPSGRWDCDGEEEIISVYTSSKQTRNDLIWYSRQYVYWGVLFN